MKCKAMTKKALLVLVFFVNFIPNPSMAEITSKQEMTMKKIQNYLNGIKTFKARVLQTNPDGQLLFGKVYIKKDSTMDYGKLRIEYDQENQGLIIADGEKLILHDPIARENTVYGIEQTPAAFLLQKRIDLENDFTIKSLTEKSGQIELVMTKFGAGDACVTLKFSTIPMLKFTGWTIIDMQANRTDVDLEDVLIGIKLSSHLFTPAQ